MPKITIESLAQMSQREFTTIRSEMREGFTEVLRAIEAVDTHLSAYASHWREDFERLTGKVETLEKRVQALETSAKK